ALANPIAQDHSKATITDDDIPDTKGAMVFFTSSNFTVKDTTFSSKPTNTVADAMVAGIESATKSIHLASDHIRARPTAEALMAAKKAKPALDIKVYLDSQEYISAAGDASQDRDLESCLAAAGANDAKKRACTDKGFLFGNKLGKAGIDVRYKY